MKIYIIIPVFNEGHILRDVLESFVNQTERPDRIIIINDNSTDNSQLIINQFIENHEFIDSYTIMSDTNHRPGSKVINAFYSGLMKLDTNFDLIGKFDADIILPLDYFERMVSIFASDDSIGIAGGNLYIKKKKDWIFENISAKTKVRGPIKLYRKKCFDEIGRLKKTIGWDTIDELLAQYHGWKIKTDPSLHVKHLKPTGASYNSESRHKQGEAFYKMRYGFLLTQIASIKLAVKKNSFRFYLDSIKGYKKSRRNKIPHAVTEDEGKFIRSLRWRNIKKKLF